MPIQLCVDESGGKGSSKWFCAAGLAAKAESWAAFSDEWASALKEDRKISNAFKMKKVAKWPKEEREVKLRNLVDILFRHVDFICYTVVDLEAHSEMWEKVLRKKISNHYFLCFIETIITASIYLNASGSKEKFEAIFDTQDYYGKRACEWYPLFRKIISNRSEGTSKILPTSPIYRADEDFLPLQAADMLAWCMRDFMENDGSSEFEWIIKKFSGKAVDFNALSRREFMDRLSGIKEKNGSVSV